MRVGSGSCAWANAATAPPSSAAGTAEFCNAEPVDGTARERVALLPRPALRRGPSCLRYTSRRRPMADVRPCFSGPGGGRASEPARTFLHTGTDMDSVFIYWDNSNIFHEAQRIAEEEEEGPDARFRVRVHFENILRLAHADRPVEKALAAGSVPPEMRQLWNRMDAQGLSVHLYDRGAPGRGEQEIPDRYLQLRMLEDALDYNGDPGIVVLLTGDGAGYLEGAGFHSTLERMHRRNWRVEILSWAHSTNPRIRRWAEANGIFVSLDDFYDAITFLVPSNPGFALARPRKAAELDLSKRRLS